MTTRKIKTTLQNACNEANKLLDEINKLEKEATDPTRSESYKASARLRIRSLRMQIEGIRNRSAIECKKIIEGRRGELIQNRRLKSENITDDAKLFNLGITLPIEEVEAIFDRNAGNRTMQRLAQMYCQEHNMEMSGNRAIIDTSLNELTGLENTSIMFLDHWLNKNNNSDMLDKFFPETTGAENTTTE